MAIDTEAICFMIRERNIKEYNVYTICYKICTGNTHVRGRNTYNMLYCNWRKCICYMDNRLILYSTILKTETIVTKGVRIESVISLSDNLQNDRELFYFCHPQ